MFSIRRLAAVVALGAVACAAENPFANCIIENDHVIVCNGTSYDSEHEEKLTYASAPTMFIVYIAISVGLVLFAGVFSGLTMGLMSLDLMTLTILKKSGKPDEQKYASRILPLVKRHHLLLVSLLLANAACMEALPIFLDAILPQYLAIIISVTGVLLFGEILPQAICTRYGLAIGYYCAPIVYGLMGIVFILAWPISKLMDLVLGTEHGTFFRRAELSELVNIHYGEKENEENEEPLSLDEMLIIKGALAMTDKETREAMTNVDDVFSVSVDAKMDAETMKLIIKKGFTRVPVYQDDPSNFIGILLVKTLIMLDPEDATPVSECVRRYLPFVEASSPLYDVLNQFQVGKSHIATVMEGAEVVGIISLEDIIEELLGEEIVDETDEFVDVHQKIRVSRMVRNMSKSRLSGVMSAGGGMDLGARSRNLQALAEDSDTEGGDVESQRLLVN